MVAGEVPWVSALMRVRYTPVCRQQCWLHTRLQGVFLVLEGNVFQISRNFPGMDRILTRKKRIDNSRRPLFIGGIILL